MPITKLQLSKLVEKYQRFCEKAHTPASLQTEEQERAEKEAQSRTQKSK